MTSDLLFSILPREGKVPIKTETQKVEKIDKLGELKPLTDEEQELRLEEREARQNQQQQHKNKDAETAVADEQTAANENTKPAADEQSLQNAQSTSDKKPKGPKHLDVYV